MLASLRVLTHRLRRRVLLHRRPLAALAVALAAYAAVVATSAPPPATVPVWTAAHDLAAGQQVRPDDLVEVDFPPQSVPRDALSDPRALIGRVVSRHVGRGQPVDPSVVIGERWTRDQGGLAVVPVRISDAAVVELVRPGDRVALFATDVTGSTAAASLLVSDARVVSVPMTETEAPGAGLPGRLVLLGVPPEQVEDVTTATARQFLSIAWSR